MWWVIGIAVVIGVLLYFFRDKIFKQKPQEDKPNGEEPEPDKPLTIDSQIDIHQTRIKNNYYVFLAPMFLPEFLYSHRIKDEDAKWLLDEYVKQQGGNAVRVFLISEAWAWKYTQWQHQMFKKDGEGKYIINLQDIGSSINSSWIHMVAERLVLLTERHIGVIISLLDNCGMHYKENCAWGIHWLNGNNNRLGTATSAGKVWDCFDKNTEQHKNTRKVLEAVLKYVIAYIWGYLTPEERKYLFWMADNEGKVTDKFLTNVQVIIDTATGEVVSGKKWLTSSGSLVGTAIHQPHHIGNLNAIKGIKQAFPNKKQLMPSSDGYKENGQKVLVDKDTVYEMTKYMLEQGWRGIEFMNGHRQDEIRLPKIGQKWYNVKQTDFERCRAVTSAYYDFKGD